MINLPKLEIVLSSADQTKIYKVKAFFSTTYPGDNQSFPFENNTWIALNEHMNNGLCAPNTSNQCTWTIDHSVIKKGNSNQTPNDNTFIDFAVVRTDDDTPTEGESTLILVDNYDVGAKDVLKFDLTAPQVSVSYPAHSSRGFNEQKITYTLTESVVSGSLPRFDG